MKNLFELKDNQIIHRVSTGIIVFTLQDVVDILNSQHEKLMLFEQAFNICCAESDADKKLYIMKAKIKIKQGEKNGTYKGAKENKAK